MGERGKFGRKQRDHIFNCYIHFKKLHVRTGVVTQLPKLWLATVGPYIVALVRILAAALLIQLPTDVTGRATKMAQVLEPLTFTYKT